MKIDHPNNFRLMKRHFLFVFLLLFCSFISLASTVGAAEYAVKRTVNEGVVLPAGTLVVSESTDKVRSAMQSEGQYVFGVIAPQVDSTRSSRAVGVLSSGIVSVLVSDIAGTIKAGDRIAISAIEGVGMKAQSAGWMIGIAQRDFSAVPQEAVREEVIASDGKRVTVSVKELPVLFTVSYYNPNISTNVGGAVGAVKQVIEALTGQPVSAVRVAWALIIFSIAMILLVALIYSAVRNSIAAIGRNPLAHIQIVETLIKVLATTMVVIVFALVLIYFVVTG